MRVLKYKKIPHFGNNSNHRITETESLSWLGTGISITSGRVKPNLWVQISSFSEMMRSYECDSNIRHKEYKA